MAVISPLVEEHRKTLKPGEPQLNYCDPAVMVSGATSLYMVTSSWLVSVVELGSAWL